MAEKAKAPAIRFKGFTDDWEQRKFGEVVIPYTDPVATPSGGYIRLGIRSHAKGTFHTYVCPGMELETAKMHRVGKNNFIVNITFSWEHAVAITDENDAGKLVSHRFPQFSFIEGMVPRCFKFAILDEKFRHHLWISSPGGAGRNRVLKINEMLEYPFWVTSEDEQKKIAGFLLNLDNLITLHQCKSEKLQNVKKAMLEKMFPKNGSNVPEIRFAGFTDAWKQRKLGELGNLKNGMNFSKEAMGIGYPFVNLQNIFGKNIIDTVNLGKAEATQKQLNDYNLIDGDILFVRSSVKLEGVGEAALVPKNLENTTYSGFIIRFRDEKGINNNFKRYVFSTQPIRNQIISRQCA